MHGRLKVAVTKRLKGGGISHSWASREPGMDHDSGKEVRVEGSKK
jgi:hypothetical protein